MKRSLTTLLLVCLLGSVSATVVRQLRLPDLVGRAEVVLEGRCLATRVEAREPDLLVTVVTLRVTRAWKGVEQDAEFSFVLPGGERDGKGLLVPGMPAFRPGDEVFLFLTAASSRGLRVPVGLGQGVLRLRRQGPGGPVVLVQDLEGLELVDEAGEPVPPATGTEDYQVFAARVKALLEEDG